MRASTLSLRMKSWNSAAATWIATSRREAFPGAEMDEEGRGGGRRVARNKTESGRATLEPGSNRGASTCSCASLSQRAHNVGGVYRPSVGAGAQLGCSV